MDPALRSDRTNVRIGKTSLFPGREWGLETGVLSVKSDGDIVPGCRYLKTPDPLIRPGQALAIRQVEAPPMEGTGHVIAPDRPVSQIPPSMGAPVFYRIELVSKFEKGDFLAIGNHQLTFIVVFRCIFHSHAFHIYPLCSIYDNDSGSIDQTCRLTALPAQVDDIIRQPMN
jgi:hypothetical protein